MRKNTLYVLGVIAIVAAALLAAGACAQKGGAPKAKGGVVATVGDKSITTDDFNEILKRIPPFNRKRYATKAGKMELLDKLIEEELFYQEAMRKGLDKDKEYTSRMEQIRRGILASMVKKDLYEADIPVTDAEIKDYFDKNTDKFQTPESVKVKLILVRSAKAGDDKANAEAKAKIDAAYKKLKAGVPWEKVVDEYSDDRASKKKDGELPDVRKGLRGDEFDNVAFAMSKKGEISPPFSDKRGWNIIQFEEKTPAKTKDFEEVKKTIERRLKQDKQKDKMDATMKQLREKAAVKVNDDVLDAIPVDTGPAEGGAPGGMPQLGGEGEAPAAGEGAPNQQKLMEMMKAQQGQGGAPAPGGAPVPPKPMAPGAPVAPGAPKPPAPAAPAAGGGK
jgi:peptidyl-prolyl cis-trans isomerase C